MDLFQRRPAIEPLVDAQGLTKYFDRFLAVDRVSMQVYPGEILALLGPNGAGKTTTIRMLASILKPSSGLTRIDGVDVASDPAGVRMKMGILTEHHGLYSRMRADEYLAFFGKAYGLDAYRIEQNSERLLQQFGLLEARSRRLGEYSKGMRQKLALARALLHDPSIVMLDEPTSAMDPASARQVREYICSLRSASRAVLICTHNLHEAEFLADRIAIMREGRIVSQGSIDHLRQTLLGRPLVVLRYRGDSSIVEDVVSSHGELQRSEPGTLHFFSASPDTDNPELLRLLLQAGVEVLSIAEEKRNLEEIYLEVLRTGGGLEVV